MRRELRRRKGSRRVFDGALIVVEGEIHSGRALDEG
jgi:hypothetical protein